VKLYLHSLISLYFFILPISVAPTSQVSVSLMAGGVGSRGAVSVLNFMKIRPVEKLVRGTLMDTQTHIFLMKYVHVFENLCGVY